MIVDPEKDINFKKIVFGIFFLIVLGVVALWANRPASQIILTAHNNKFNVNFQISSRDKTGAAAILGQANLPQNILEGAQFELDSTSSAKLAFMAPVTIDLEFTKERLNFRGIAAGVLSHAAVTPFANLQIPASTSLAILAPDFANLVKKRFAMPKDFQTWLDQNLTSESGQYLIVFGESGDFALATKPSNPPDFATLAAQSDEFYKEESDANLLFHLVKLPQESQKEITFTFFEQGPFLFMASSRAAAQELANVQKGTSPSLNFWPEKEKTISAVLFWQNSQTVNQDPLSFLVGEDTRLDSARQARLAATLAKIREARLILKDRQFWGYLDFSGDHQPTR